MVFYRVIYSRANLREQKTFFKQEKSPTSTEFVGNTNMATVSLFWNTNMAAMTSCEYALYVKMPNFMKTSTNEDELFSSMSLPTFDKISDL